MDVGSNLEHKLKILYQRHIEILMIPHGNVGYIGEHNKQSNENWWQYCCRTCMQNLEAIYRIDWDDCIRMRMQKLNEEIEWD